MRRCLELGRNALGRGDIIKRFAKSGRADFYLAIEKTGELGADDEFEFVIGEANEPSIFEIVRERFNLYLKKLKNARAN